MTLQQHAWLRALALAEGKEVGAVAARKLGSNRVESYPMSTSWRMGGLMRFVAYANYRAYQGCTEVVAEVWRPKDGDHRSERLRG